MPTLADDLMPPTLSPEEYDRLGLRVAEHCGLHLGELLRPRVERCLAQRFRDRGVDSLERYWAELNGDRRELGALCERIVPGETFFFRDGPQLYAFSTRVLPVLASRNAQTRRLNLWSAGCSTGEEAYTLAILVAESGLFEDWSVTIWGTDFSARALHKARRGAYPERALREASPSRRARFFTHGTDASRVVVDIQRAVTFRRLNLNRVAARDPLPVMDVIFCRNVLIYWTAADRGRLLQTFRGKLKPGGWLYLGHAEALNPGLASAFDGTDLQRDWAYRRPHGESPL
ncbi:MAG TPA: protein-glutamate O-methyltransferase CheR [Myxococcaceae bacterium]|nr:protein-glutamate O-methyltransferase CheR [Myxococcaceae bacterium]